MPPLMASSTNDSRERGKENSTKKGRLREIMEEELMLGLGESVDPAELSETAPAEIVSEEEDDFEFAFSIESDPGYLADTTADEIFYNGRIRPAYPLFNRDLIDRIKGPKEEEEELAEGVAQFMLEYEKDDMSSVSESSASSIVSEEKNVDRIRGAASAPNFVPRKSSSTGTSASASASRRWKLRDIVVGRSRSDGKERFVVIPLSAEKEKKEKEKEKKKEKSGKGKGETVKEMDIVTAHRIYYGKVGSGGGQPVAAGSGRRSFLPYRQELLGGIFGNAKHHIHPF